VSGSGINDADGRYNDSVVEILDFLKVGDMFWVCR